MDILIYAIPDDDHISAVRWGLAQFGVTSEVWIPGDLPDFATLSISHTGGRTRASVRHDGRVVELSDARLIWNRRVETPSAPAAASVHDRFMIEHQSWAHITNVISLLDRAIPTINAVGPQHRAGKKAVQLVIAHEAGMRTPETLISNDFDLIRDFWAEHSGHVVVKPYHTFSWAIGAERLLSFTAVMPQPTRDLRLSLEVCPQIFQRRVKKILDVRVVAFSDQVYAAGVASDAAAEEVDSRKGILTAPGMFRKVSVPNPILSGVAEFMRISGLQFGAFDFVVDEGGEWIFLECNESGQFLYLEQFIPSMLLLDPFCRWLAELAGRKAPDQRLRFSDFEKDRGAARFRDYRSHKRRAENPAHAVEG